MYGSCVYMEKVLKNRPVILRIMYIALVVVLAAVDQLTKYLTVEFIKPKGTIPLIKIGETEWLNFTYCENTGMSFSLLEGQRLILIAVPLILIAGVTFLVFTGKMNSGRTDICIALAALAGGGLGNLIDRILNGYVVDFIDVRIINFAIFNFADICAVCGGIYFGVMLAVDEIKEEKAKKAQEASENAAVNTETAPSDGEENGQA